MFHFKTPSTVVGRKSAFPVRLGDSETPRSTTGLARPVRIKDFTSQTPQQSSTTKSTNCAQRMPVRIKELNAEENNKSSRKTIVKDKVKPQPVPLKYLESPPKSSRKATAAMSSRTVDKFRKVNDVTHSSVKNPPSALRPHTAGKTDHFNKDFLKSGELKRTARRKLYPDSPSKNGVKEADSACGLPSVPSKENSTEIDKEKPTRKSQILPPNLIKEHHLRRTKNLNYVSKSPTYFKISNGSSELSDVDVEKQQDMRNVAVKLFDSRTYSVTDEEGSQEDRSSIDVVEERTYNLTALQLTRPTVIMNSTTKKYPPVKSQLARTEEDKTRANATIQTFLSMVNNNCTVELDKDELTSLRADLMTKISNYEGILSSLNATLSHVNNLIDNKKQDKSPPKENNSMVTTATQYSPERDVETPETSKNGLERLVSQYSASMDLTLPVETPTRRNSPEKSPEATTLDMDITPVTSTIHQMCLDDSQVGDKENTSETMSPRRSQRIATRKALFDSDEETAIMNFEALEQQLASQAFTPVKNFCEINRSKTSTKKKPLHELLPVNSKTAPNSPLPMMPSSLRKSTRSLREYSLLRSSVNFLVTPKVDRATTQRINSNNDNDESPHMDTRRSISNKLFQELNDLYKTP